MIYFVDGIDGGRLNPRVSRATCLPWRKKAWQRFTCEVQTQRGRETRPENMWVLWLETWKKRGHDFYAISFAVPSYAIKAALTNSGPSILGFLRFDPRKYTKLHLNALFSVQFTRLVPNFIVLFLPWKMDLHYLFYRYSPLKKALNDCSFSISLFFFVNDVWYLLVWYKMETNCTWKNGNEM